MQLQACASDVIVGAFDCAGADTQSTTTVLGVVHAVEIALEIAAELVYQLLRLVPLRFEESKSVKDFLRMPLLNAVGLHFRPLPGLG